MPRYPSELRHSEDSEMAGLLLHSFANNAAFCFEVLNARTRAHHTHTPTRARTHAHTLKRTHIAWLRARSPVSLQWCSKYDVIPPPKITDRTPASLGI